jgi:TonB family protein
VALREKRDVAVKGAVTADGDAEVDSPNVDKEAVAKFITQRLRSVQDCYEAQLKRSPGLRGKLVIRFVIGQRGQVIEASVDQDTMNDEAVAACVLRIVRRWKLPFTPDAETPVSFPFLFAPG